MPHKSFTKNSGSTYGLTCRHLPFSSGSTPSQVSSVLMSLRWPASRLLSVSDMSGWMEGTKFPNHATSSSSIEVGFIWSFPWSSAAIINKLYVILHFYWSHQYLLSIIASKNELPIIVTLFWALTWKAFQKFTEQIKVLRTLTQQPENKITF